MIDLRYAARDRRDITLAIFLVNVAMTLGPVQFMNDM
jgi:hypothetical protein